MGAVISVSAEKNMVREGIKNPVEVFAHKTNGLIRVNRFQVWGWIFSYSDL